MVKKRRGGKLKWIIIALVVLGVIGTATGEGDNGGGTDTEKTYQEANKQSPELSSETDRKNQEPQKAETSSESEAESQTGENESETIAETDIDIITRTNHPTYYVSVAKSHVIWDDVSDEKIIFADSFDQYKDTTILSMDAYRDSDIIRGIDISFSHFDKPVNYSVTDALPIIASYMPYDIIEKYYQFESAKKILPDEDHSDKTAYYTITYSLTDDGSDAYYSGEHEYSGSIDVIIALNENKKVDSFNIGFGTPRWMLSLSQNGYYSKSWKCNLEEYMQTQYAEGTEQCEITQIMPETEQQTEGQAEAQQEEQAEPEIAAPYENAAPEPAPEAPADTAGAGMVWLSATGSKYHSIPDCGKMNPSTARQISEADAIASGYSACSKCH